ncbi:MAG: hypothetical protein AB7R00_14905 [Kofleriaceae bacterium]
MVSIPLRLVSACVVVGAIGCEPDAPASPSFQVDVLPILAANCVRCHGAPTLGGAPTAFRLDRFEDTVIVDGVPGPELCGETPVDPSHRVVLCGAASMAGLVAARLRDEFYPMPPRFPLEEHQIETLERWAESPGRGEPRVNNHPPALELLATQQVGTNVQIRIAVTDPDRDLVTGTLRVDIAGQSRFVSELRSGTLDVTWNATGVAPGNYSLIVELDDGSAVFQTDPRIVTVSAPQLR